MGLSAVALELVATSHGFGIARSLMVSVSLALDLVVTILAITHCPMPAGPNSLQLTQYPQNAVNSTTARPLTGPWSQPFTVASPS